MNAPDFFFIDRKDPNALNSYNITKKLCNSCPIKWICLDYAMTNHEEDGMWGGLSPDERRATRRRQAV